MRKHFSIALLLILIIATCCSCGRTEPQAGTISPRQGFDNAGFVEITCEQGGSCDFIANDVSISHNITWEAYVFSKSFDDALRYIPQSSYKDHIDISTAGTIKVKKGDHLYIYCSENSFTLDSVESSHADASLAYSIK